MHSDSAVYTTVAQGIAHGQLPYRDFVDNKGPLMYFLSVPGILLGGFTGIWITEFLLIFISVIFAYKTALFFVSKGKSVFTTGCTFIYAITFFTVSAGVEEYSLPFLMASMYLFTKFYFSAQHDISLIELMLLGFCFACTLFIRPNVFTFWMGFCMVIFFEAIIKRRFVLPLKYIFGFCIGISIAAVPIFLYLYLNGIINDFINQVIFAGASRGVQVSGLKELVKRWFDIINRPYCIIPVIFGIFCCIKEYKRPDFTFFIGYTFSYLLMIFLFSLSGSDLHFNMTLIPFFVPLLASFIEALNSHFLEIKTKNIAIVVLFCVIFSEGLAKYIYNITESLRNKSGKEMIAAGKIIDTNTTPGDKIISLSNAYIYPFTKRRSVSKYIYQGSGVDHIQGSREEFLAAVLNDKPAIIATYPADVNWNAGWYAPIYEMIANEYYLLSNENGYYLFKRKS
ncbi:hypothetical protein FACS189494_00240 [Spirochaetia bacterium]|nr:hypothetical protein FACS189494_00240 [Spirochaetia bacterium]